MRWAAVSGASQTMVMREVSARSDSPTVRETMLMLRRRKGEGTGERGRDGVGGGLGRLADDGHARGVGALGLAYGEGDDVDVEAAEERGDAGEDAGFVLHEGYEGVEHWSCPFSVLCCSLRCVEFEGTA